MSADPIPAVTEAAADGDTARLFAELRDTLQVPFVNLIWRHLATVPGGLAWTWGLLKPVYLSPVLGAAADALVAGIDAPRGALPGCVLEAAGVRAADRGVIRAMLGDYNRANALNFLALSLACRVLRGEVVAPGGVQAERQAAAGPARRVVAVLPPLPALDALPVPVRALIVELDQFGRSGPSEAVGSLWRHLAHWPGFLALAHTGLEPFQRDGTLRRRGDAVIAAARPVVVERLQPLLPEAGPALPPEAAGRVLAGLDQFTRLMIGRMTVLGVALLALLPEEAAGAG